MVGKTVETLPGSTDNFLLIFIAQNFQTLVLMVLTQMLSSMMIKLVILMGIMILTLMTMF